MPLCVCLRVIFVYCTVLGCGFGFKGMETAAAIVLHLSWRLTNYLSLLPLLCRACYSYSPCCSPQLFCITIMYVVANL